MAKTVPLQIIRAVMTKHGGPPFSLQQDEAASQTFAIGQLVKYVAGLMTAVVTDATIYGVAHGIDVFPGGTARTTGTADFVWLGDPNTLFAGNLVDGVSGDVPGDHVLVQADLGAVKGMVFKTTPPYVFVDANGSPSNLKVFVHRPCGGSEGELGDTNARVLFTFLPQSLQDLLVTS